MQLEMSDAHCTTEGGTRKSSFLEEHKMGWRGQGGKLGRGFGIAYIGLMSVGKREESTDLTEEIRPAKELEKENWKRRISK